MNCHHHDFVGNPSHHSAASGSPRNAMPEIVIRHNVNQGGLTTNYTHQEVGITTLEQKRQRQSALAMAKAEAVTSRYSHICGPNAKLPVQEHRQLQKQQQQRRKSSSSTSPASLHSQLPSPATASTMKQAPPPQQQREPNYLALSDSFRKSSSSILSMEDEGQQGTGNSSSHQAAATASTEVTAEILTPKQHSKKKMGNLKDDDDYKSTEDLEDWVVTKRPPSLGPSFAARQQQQQQHPSTRRVSDSNALFATTQGGVSLNQTFRDQRTSFQEGSTPTKLYPTKSTVQELTTKDLYTELLQYQRELWRSNNTSATTTTAAVTSNHMKGTFGCGQHDDDETPPAPASNPLTAVEEQEALWRELTNQQNNVSNNNINNNSAHNLLYKFDVSTTATATTSTTATPADPREEQARLWEQIRRERLLRQEQQEQPQPQHSHCTAGTLPPPSTRISALEEQAQLLEEIQRNARRNNNGDTTPMIGSRSMPPAVMEQERLLQALRQQPQPQRPSSSSSSSIMAPPKLSPIELQAQRLRQIQDEKEQEIVEMACKMSAVEDHSSHNSSSIPSLALSSLSGHAGGGGAGEEDDLSLQYIIDLSKREAEAQSQVEEKALQLAMERSREDLGGIIVTTTTTTTAEDNAVVDEQQQQEEQEQREMLELRRSIAELACQVSEGTLEAAESNNSHGRPRSTTNTTATLATPIAANRQRRRHPWGLKAFRYR